MKTALSYQTLLDVIRPLPEDHQHYVMLFLTAADRKARRKAADLEADAEERAHFRLGREVGELRAQLASAERHREALKAELASREQYHLERRQRLLAVVQRLTDLLGKRHKTTHHLIALLTRALADPAHANDPGTGQLLAALAQRLNDLLAEQPPGEEPDGPD